MQFGHDLGVLPRVYVLGNVVHLTAVAWRKSELGKLGFRENAWVIGLLFLKGSKIVLKGP